MNSLFKYIKEVVYAFVSLAKGLLLTLRYFITIKKVNITEEYPDNRKTTISVKERFSGKVVLVHDENNEHKCTACTLCQIACPNNSIQIISKQIETEDGKNKRVLDKWVYHLDMCTFCYQCVDACPQNAIEMRNSFELSVYDRRKLIYQLNQPGSKLKEKTTVKEQQS
jgi:NADH-quinone oxidoreductase subunit I